MLTKSQTIAASLGFVAMTTTYLFSGSITAITNDEALEEKSEIPSMPTGYAFLTSGETNSFAFIKFIYFTDTNGSSDWWKWSFEYKYKGSLATAGFAGKKSADELKAACSAAYKAKLNDKVKTAPEKAIGNDQYQEEEIWTYCSPIGRKPISIKDRTSSKYKEKFKNSDPQNQLISVDDPNNSLFWEIKQKWFFNDSRTFQDTFLKPNEDTAFKDFYNEERYKNDSEKRKIKDKCKERYDNLVTQSNPSDPIIRISSEVFQYCSI